MLNVTKEMERKIQESLIDQTKNIKQDLSLSQATRVTTPKSDGEKVVIGLLVVAIVLLVGNMALGAYNMTRNKTGFKKVKKVF